MLSPLLIQDVLDVRRKIPLRDIRFGLTYIFPRIPDDDVREAKIMISIKSSNTIADCENLFIPDFVKLDKLVTKIEKKKQEDSEYLMENLGGM